MNKIKFSKMQSLGNDFIVIYETEAISEIFNFKKVKFGKWLIGKKESGGPNFTCQKIR